MERKVDEKHFYAMFLSRHDFGITKFGNQPDVTSNVFIFLFFQWIAYHLNTSQVNMPSFQMFLDWVF